MQTVNIRNYKKFDDNHKCYVLTSLIFIKEIFTKNTWIINLSLTIIIAFEVAKSPNFSVLNSS